MGRWTDDGEGTVFLSPEKNIVLQSRSVAGHFTDNHNADCDAYEQRIAELTDELARVKAESLRVVKDGEARYWHCCEGVCLYDDGEPMLSFEGQYGSYSNRYPQRDEIVQPVMLELWDRPC